MTDTQLVLVVLDGWGLNKDYEGNAIVRADTPVFDDLWQNYPKATLEASGLSVGLPEGQMGTSEVNHLTIGAGRVVYQDLVRVSQAIEAGDFFDNQVLQDVMGQVKQNNSRLHLMGLLSDGGVHSHIQHLKALLKMAQEQEVSQVLVHAFTDGRDTNMRSGLGFVAELEQEMDRLGLGKIASIVGRYYAMDRDHNWERTDKAYELLTQARGAKASSATQALEQSYENEVTDEFVEPVWLVHEDKTIQDGDGVIFFNFRNDRPRQLTERFLEKGPKHLAFATMTQYEPSYGLQVAYEPISIDSSLGEVLSKQGVKQLRITETEKFAHMTYFINCKYEDPHEGEDRIMLDSYSDIKTHDERPTMRVTDIAQQIMEAMRGGSHQVIFTNFCNPDMVGHTGNIPAVIQACEATDKALGRVLEVAKETGHTVLVTADHGNADEMIDDAGEIMTSHSTNPVPFVLVSPHWKKLKRDTGTLIDIAPTILTMLQIDIPEQMEGISLV